MLNLSLRVSGIDIIVRLEKGIHLFGSDSGIGKTYFAKVIQQLADYNEVNAIVVNLRNIDEVLRLDLSGVELVIVESTSAISASGKLVSLLDKVKDKYVIMDMKEYMFDYDFDFKHARFRFSVNKLEVTE